MDGEKAGKPARKTAAWPWYVLPLMAVVAAALLWFPPLSQPGFGEMQHTLEAVDGQRDVVNINTATAEELAVLPGIGAAKAAAIVEYREESGGFAVVEDLLEVSGIGPATLEKLQEYVCV